MIRGYNTTNFKDNVLKLESFEVLLCIKLRNLNSIGYIRSYWSAICINPLFHYVSLLERRAD